MSALVAIVMGSQSDWDTMRHAAETLKALDVPHDCRIVSAHRTPDRLFSFAKTAKAQGFKVVIAPEDGYGPSSEQNHVRVPLADLPDDVEPEEGMEFEATGPDGEVMHFWVEGVEGEEVILSLDHPLAGVTLHFDVKVNEVREASKEELEHGHAHGPGTSGHHDHH